MRTRTIGIIGNLVMNEVYDAKKQSCHFEIYRDGKLILATRDYNAATQVMLLQAGY